MNRPFNPALGADNRIAIVYPRKPMPGALAVAVQEDRLDEMGALERESKANMAGERNYLGPHSSWW